MLLQSNPTIASTISYQCGQTNGSYTTDCAIGESQFVTTVEDNIYSATFLFENIGEFQSSIANIYFDDSSSLFDFTTATLDDSASGVDFSEGASPHDLPNGVYNFDVAYATDSDAAKPWNGINNEIISSGNEILGITVDYGTGDFSALMAALYSGTFQIGLHAIAFGDDGSEWFTNVVPIPAAAWLFGSALIGFIGFARRTSV